MAAVPRGAALAGLPGLAQPCPMAIPSGLVTVRQMVVWGLAAAAAARVRHRSGSRAPRPCPSPGVSARPRSVASGKTRSCRTGRGLGAPGDAGDADGEGDGDCGDESAPEPSLAGGWLPVPVTRGP